MSIAARSGILRLLLASLTLGLAAGAAQAAPKAYVGNFKDNSVTVIDTGSRTVVATVPVAAGPHGMTITPDGRWVYVASDGFSVINLIDTATNSVTRTIEVGHSPHGVTLTPGGGTLLVAVNGEDRVAFIDTRTQAVTDSVSVGKPHTIAVSPDGRVAYVSSQTPGHFALVVIDLASRSVVRTIPLEKTPRDLEFGYDGRAVYFTEAGVNAIEVLDPASNRVAAEIPTGASPHYVNHVRNTALGMAVVQGPGELFLFDPKTNKPDHSIKVGDQPHWLAVSGDGRTAYVTNEGSNTLSIVDIAGGKVESIAVGSQPRKVVVQQAAEDARVSIENFTFSPQLVTIAPGQSVRWTNNDAGPHAIAFKDGSAGSETLFPTKSFSRTFDRPGTYDYYCSIHAYMTGRVEVRAPAPATK